MNNPTFPDDFLEQNPRFKQPLDSDVVAPGTYEVRTVSEVHVLFPQQEAMNGYGQVVESMVNLPPDGMAGEPVEVRVSAERNVGGITLTHADLIGLPGSAEFFSSLNNLILTRWRESQPPTP